MYIYNKYICIYMYVYIYILKIYQIYIYIYIYIYITRVLDMCNRANITSSQDRQNNY